MRSDDTAVLHPTEDADAVDLQHYCWSERSLEQVQEFITRCRRFMLQDRGYVITAHKNGHAIGFGNLIQWFRVGEISDLIVTPALQGQGIGSAMIQRLTDEAVKRGIHKLEIGAAQSNPRALALYERLGFIPDHEVELDFGNGLEPVIYLVKMVR